MEFYDVNNALSKVVEYDYDVFGRLIRKRVDETGNGSFDRAEKYVYDSAGKTDPATGVPLDDVVLVFDDTGSLTNRLLHGPAIDQVFASEDAMGEILWGLTDHQGTVRDVVNYDSAANTTTIANHWQFDAFGHITEESDENIDFLYSYTGRIYDADVGLYYYRARWYDPVTGRFVSEDPIGFDGGDANQSRYIGNSAPNGTDPSGLSAVGHHWVPVSILTDPEIRGKLTDKAFEVGMGAYSGPTTPNHLYGTYGGVTHAEYNKLVKQELLDYMDHHGIKGRMGADDLESFIKNIERGLDHKGDINDSLKAFNDAIRRQRNAFLKVGRNRGFREVDSMDVWRKRGQSYLKGPRFFNTATGACLVGALGGIVNETQGALETAGSSQHFREGIRKLSEGDLNGAEQEFFGRSNEDGFFGELVDNNGEKAALLFRKEYYEAVRRARENVRNACPTQ